MWNALIYYEYISIISIVLEHFQVPGLCSRAHLFIVIIPQPFASYFVWLLIIPPIIEILIDVSVQLHLLMILLVAIHPMKKLDTSYHLRYFFELFSNCPCNITVFFRYYLNNPPLKC